MKTNARDRLFGRVLYLLTRMVQRTCRFQVSGMEGFKEAINSGRSLVFPAWHGQQTMFISFGIKFIEPSKFVCLMPDDWRGASLFAYANYLGATPFAMNLDGDTTMSQGRQLVKLVRLVMGEKNLFIAPDGPHGPAYKAKPGFTYTAQKAKAIILPVGCYCRNAYVVPRWDQFVIPYPYSRISIDIGEPYEIPEDVKDLSEIEEYLTSQLNKVTMQAAANYYEGESRK